MGSDATGENSKPGDNDGGGDRANNQDESEGFGAGFCNPTVEGRWPDGGLRPTRGPNARSQPRPQSQPSLQNQSGNHPSPPRAGSPAPAQRTSTSTSSARGAGASVTLIPEDPAQSLVECGYCVYGQNGNWGQVEIRAESSPGRGAPPGEPGWELVVADDTGSVCLSGVIEHVERGVKISRYTVRRTAPDPDPDSNSPSPFGQNAGGSRP